ncbi:glycosyltransferase family 4 protein [Pelotomaculum propionicicum]|uniref:Alpha-maltose-1-phosphate synthase n=1 Tax=Pelotomaculum propionicicum TaxID=258475 RepID=A0A4Y7RWQ6_9FIRM|nr:glycosyltransferase family 4 protein [Pelotomaculum propionicicum]TEB12707.1 Alpha-maltose-1-phosphate synthase [Pelotomaculum propionicicum]
MRILHVLAQKPGQTGSGIYLLNLMRVAAQRGHEQCLVAGISARDGVYRKDMPKDLLFLPVLFETEELPFPVPGMSDEMPYPSTRYRQMNSEMVHLWEQAFTRVLKESASFQPDLIIVHHLWLLAVLVRKLFPHHPVIAVCHGTELRQLVNAAQFSTEVIRGCRQVDRVAALSSFQKQKIEAAYGIEGERIDITGSGFNSEIFYPPVKRARGRIKALYAGKLSAAKGVPSLLRAVSRLPVSMADFQLILAGSGSGSEYEEILSLASACPFETIFTGSLPQAWLGQLMRECQIFIIPSFYEGLSLVTIEALASGLWVVASELPGMREWVGPRLEEAGIVEYVSLPRLRSTDIPFEEDLPAYEKRLTDGILRQLARAKLYTGVPMAGWEEMFRKYSWEAVFSRIEKIYAHLRTEPPTE